MKLAKIKREYRNVRISKKSHQILRKMAFDNEITLLEQIEDILDHYNLRQKYISNA